MKMKPIEVQSLYVHLPGFRSCGMPTIAAGRHMGVAPAVWIHLQKQLWWPLYSFQVQYENGLTAATRNSLENSL